MERITIWIKKHRTHLMILFFAVLLAGGAFSAITLMAKDRYWAASHLRDAVFDLGEYEESILSGDAALDDIEKTVHMCNEAAVPLNDTCSAFIGSCNEAVIRYFQDVYGVDVSPKLNTLQVMKATYPEEISQMVGGSYSSDFPGKLFLNAAVLDSFTAEAESQGTPELTSTDFSAKTLRTVYIHEAVHSLGFHSDPEFDHFTEAVTECLSQKISQYSGVKYESLTGYASIQGYAAQIVACDPGLVKEVLTGGNSHMGEYFDQKLGGGYAGYYDKLIGLLQNDAVKDRDRLAFYTQFLTYEYCKTVNANAKEIVETAGEKPVGLFELAWFLGIY